MSNLGVDPLDLPNEELPHYESAPEYSSENHARRPHTYHLLQVNRKLQLFVPYGPSVLSSYRVTTRSARFFSKKAEMDIWRTRPGETTGDHVAEIWFDTDGPLPWRPRAHFGHKDECSSSTHTMEARNFNDWSIVLGGMTYAWVLDQYDSIHVALREVSSGEELARFKFSARGTTADGGAEAGDLSICQHGIGTDKGGVEKILCGLVVALAHFKKLGRHYQNDDGVGHRRVYDHSPGNYGSLPI
jgi:hypothetical protein